MTGTFKNEPQSWFGLLPVGFLDAPFLIKHLTSLAGSQLGNLCPNRF
jgi:hypothetical protein